MEDERKWTVYKHTNKTNGKVYIGITSKKVVEYRWNHGRGYKDNKYFFNSIKKYGWEEGFSHEILFSDLSTFEAQEKEKELIKEYDCIFPKGYNNSTGGESYNVSEITRKRMSESSKGQKAWNKGVPCTEEVKRKISAKVSGEKNGFYGKKHSEENKLLLRNLKLGKRVESSCKKVICNEKIFESMVDCAKEYDIDPRNMSDWLIGRRNMPINFFEMGLKYLESDLVLQPQKGRVGENNPSAKKVICLNTLEIFNTMKEACDKYSVNINSMVSCCKGKRKSAGKLEGNKLVWMYYKEYVDQLEAGN